MQMITNFLALKMKCFKMISVNFKFGANKILCLLMLISVIKAV